MSQKDKKIINDEIDLISLFAVVFDNFNFLISVFISSLLVITIYYLSATKLYQSNSLLEIKQNDNTSFLPQSLRSNLDGSSGENSLQAEIEIYKSKNTIADALKRLQDKNENDEIPSLQEVKANLSLQINSKSLLAINFVSDDSSLSELILNTLNDEFINDRRNFIKQSSTAGKDFIQKKYLELNYF